LFFCARCLLKTSWFPYIALKKDLKLSFEIRGEKTNKKTEKTGKKIIEKTEL
jgi:hypothetical protein